MGKKEKKVSPEEVAAQQREEMRVMQEAYLQIYKDSRSPAGGVAELDRYGLDGRDGAFPIPQQPHYTVLRRDPLEEAEASGAVSSEQRRLATQSVRTSTTPGPQPLVLSRLLGASPEALASKELTLSAFTETARETTAVLKGFIQLLEEVCLSKLGGVLEELVANLELPFPDHEVKGYLADVAAGLAARHEQDFPHLSCLEVLVVKLYSMDGPDIDRLMSFSDAPPPYSDDTSTLWEDYTEKNPSIRRAVNDSCRLLLNEPHSREARQTAKKWIKTMCLLQGIGEKTPKTVVYKGVSNIRVDVEQLKGRFVGWVAPCSGTTSKAAAMENAGKHGMVWQITAHEGLWIGQLGQYPEAEGFVLPVGAVLEVTSVSAGQDNVAPTYVCADMVSAGTALCADFNATVTQVVADGRISAEWLLKLATLRAEDDESIDDLNLPNDGADEDEDVLSVEDVAVVEKLAFEVHTGCAYPPTARYAVLDAAEPALPTPKDAERMLARLTDAVRSSSNDLIDELADNLRGPHQRGSLDHLGSARQRMAVFNDVLSRAAGRGDTSAAELVVWLYCASAMDIDVLMGFPDVPDPPPADDPGKRKLLDAYKSRNSTDAFKADSRSRNGDVGGDLESAMRAEALDETGVKRARGHTGSLATLRAWPRTIASLQALLATHLTGNNIPPLDFPVYYVYAGDQHRDSAAVVQAAKGLEAGSVVSFPMFTACVADKDTACGRASGASGVVFEIVPGGAVPLAPLPLEGRVVGGQGTYLLPMFDYAVDVLEEGEGGGLVVRGRIQRVVWTEGSGAETAKAAMHDLRVAGRKMRAVSEAVRAGRPLTAVDKARLELVCSAADIRDLSLLSSKPPEDNAFLVVANILKIALAGGKALLAVRDALSSASDQAGGAKRLLDRISNYTTSVAKAEEADSDVYEAMQKAAIGVPDWAAPVRRTDSPAAADLRRWAAAVYTYLGRLRPPG